MKLIGKSKIYKISKTEEMGKKDKTSKIANASKISGTINIDKTKLNSVNSKEDKPK